jgi:hypothetical protein
MKHRQNIITNARQGRPLSSSNRRRRSSLWFIAAVSAIFWVLVAAAFLA